jgi:hypothetical protein
MDAESQRLIEDAHRERNWKRWGPYLADRQWGTVREDYSKDGDAWRYFPHDHARSRAYRWGEDGLLGVTDRQGRLCLALALWNGRDPILKERLFGLTGPEGNHGEDVKEAYFFLDATPTSSYLRALYKYPQAEFPYARLVEENGRRGRDQTEFNLDDTGVFDENRYFDVTVEYAKGSPNDILMRITATNHGPEAAPLWVLPTLWFRNTWSWGRTGEGYGPRPRLWRAAAGRVDVEHSALGRFALYAGSGPDGVPPRLLFTENETNEARLFANPQGPRFSKDAIHRAIIQGDADAVNPAEEGTKCAAVYSAELAPGSSMVVHLRLRAADESNGPPFGVSFEQTFEARHEEMERFYAARLPAALLPAERVVARQGYAGLLWSKQFYHYVVEQWVEGDPNQPTPPPGRGSIRNGDWPHLYNRDVISMPDTWEYPWYAAWDLAFHMIPFARIDPDFAKEQLVLLLREWYMHPNGQLPAYEYELGNVNPPVHAWAAWRIYKMTAAKGRRDRVFLSRVFQKLLLNFTWWVNRKDADGRNLFSGGFLGLDIGVFDRSGPLPFGARLEQADGTAWMAFYCSTLLSMALELAETDPAMEDMASKFFEHFVHIVDAMNRLGGTGLWDEQDGFYYDQLHIDGRTAPLRVRSMVGIIPLFAVEVLETDALRRLSGFHRRMRWFLDHRPDLARHVSYMERDETGGSGHRLLAIPSRERLQRVLRYVLDENEFLSPHGIRSLSRVHRDQPFVLRYGRQEYRVGYVPGESDSAMFGGNSNWRGPIWLPLNFLLIEALERYHYFYGTELRVELPTGSGRWVDLGEVACELSRRICGMFLPDRAGRRPCHGDNARFSGDGRWRDLLLFHEYFHGEDGRGLGASHQTGWTALVVRLLEDLAQSRGSTR